MKKIIFILVLFIFAVSTYSQTPVFNNTIGVKQTFNSDTQIYPFNGQTLYGIGITGNIVFNSDSSLVRIIIGDNSGNEYMIYETYTMLDTVWNFNFNQECEETCFLDGYIGTTIIIQIVDATVYLSQLKWNNSPSENLQEKQIQAKKNKDSEKINRINSYINQKGMLWIADHTSASNIFYKNKKKYFGNKYQSCGFEYYRRGLFEFYNSDVISDPTYNIIGHFDWRKKHDAHISTSQYFDYNPDQYETGNGWMTAVKCQSGCWDSITGEYQCNDEQGGCPEGFIYMETGACTGFTGVGMVEAMFNIYNNQHYNLDLSEMELSAEVDNQLSHPCLSVCDGGGVLGVLGYILDHGIMDDNSFPFLPLQDPCPPCNLQNPAQEIIHIAGYDNDNNINGGAEIKTNLINNGPLGWEHFMPSSFSNHAMVLVGFGTISEGDPISQWFPYPIPPGHPHIGETYWIFKGSGGPIEFNNGYIYLYLNEYPENLENIITPITVEFGSYSRLCRDEDLDGYFNWGIGLPPDGCSGEMDGNDNNPSLGPMDENGFCKIIDTYTVSFEEDGLDQWKQCGCDDKDWIQHNKNLSWPYIYTPDCTPDGSTYYLFLNHIPTPLTGSAILESPYIDFSQNCTNEFNMWFYRGNSWGMENSAIEVKGSSDGGLTWFNLWGEYGNGSTTGWQEVNLVLSSTINKIRILAKGGIFPDTTSVFAIDAITISKTDNTGPLVVNHTLVIDADYHACDNIYIMPGAILTINPNCTLYMPQGKKIIVQRNGILRIDGGKITSDGIGYWKGIDVWGTNGQPQTPLYQGMVNINSEGIIENAVCGIRATKMEDEISNPAYSGGIVYATNANFTNNIASVVFYPYSVTSVSFFESSDFLLNDELPSGPAAGNFISLNGINGVQFRYISVNDMRSTILVEQKATGIYSYNASYSLQDVCSQYDPSLHCIEWDYSELTGLKYGIYAIATNPNSYIDIRHTAFDLNFRGLYISGMTDARVTSNQFNINNPFFTKGGYGMYLNHSTGYWVEDNDYLHNGQTPIGVGLIVHHSGSSPNEVYRNRFTILTLGISAQEQNCNLGFPPQGLQIKCNDFDVCTSDILVPNTKMAGYGISPNQGSDSNDPEDMAGNLFYIPSPTPDGDFDDINNQGRHVTYYHPSNYDPILYPNVLPKNYTHEPPYNTVTLVSKNVSEPWTPENGCPPGIEGGGGGGGGGEKFRRTDGRHGCGAAEDRFNPKPAGDAG